MKTTSNSRVLRTISLLLIAVLFCPLIYGKVIYVDDDAVGTNDGTSWDNAYVYLQDALADADLAEKPIEIRVAQGIYRPDQGANYTPGDRGATFQLINGVSMYGGFPSGGAEFGDRNPNLFEAILSGDLLGNDIYVSDPFDLLNEPTRAENVYHVVTGSRTDETAVLDGFAITAGNANIISTYSYGGGMYNESGHPTLTNCTFSENSARYGGGMYNKNRSHPSVHNCIFRDNVAESYGGGMHNQSYSSPTLTNCIFERNHADNSAGGIRNYNHCSPRLTGCTFSGNTAAIVGGGIYNMSDCNPILNDCTFRGNLAASNGGGVWNYSSSPTLINCIFCGNSVGWYGGGMFNARRDSPTMTNCTFAQNLAQNGDALACNDSAGNVEIVNCILWDDDDEIWNNDGSTIIVAYSNIQGGFPGEGNIATDPLFADPGYWANMSNPNIVVEPNDQNAVWVDGDYHLKSEAGRWDPSSDSWMIDDVTSPCIDAGDPNSPIPFEPYPDGGIINIGAYGDTAEASKSPSGVHAKYGGGTGEPNDPYQKIWNDRPLIVKVVISR